MIHRYGLDSDNIPRSARSRNVDGGFVDLGNESEYASSGHQPSGADEVFASEQGDRPWYDTLLLSPTQYLFFSLFNEFVIDIFLGGKRIFL